MVNFIRRNAPATTASPEIYTGAALPTDPGNYTLFLAGSKLYKYSEGYFQVGGGSAAGVDVFKGDVLPVDPGNYCLFLVDNTIYEYNNGYFEV